MQQLFENLITKYTTRNRRKYRANSETPPPTHTQSWTLLKTSWKSASQISVGLGLPPHIRLKEQDLSSFFCHPGSMRTPQPHGRSPCCSSFQCQWLLEIFHTGTALWSPPALPIRCSYNKALIWLISTCQISPKFPCTSPMAAAIPTNPYHQAFGLFFFKPEINILISL